MANTVIKAFRDKVTGKVYRKGDSYSLDDDKRVAFLIENGCLEGVSVKETPSIDIPEAPSNDVAEHNGLQLMTKKELTELLTRKDIKFNKSDSKEELIQLLLGGE
jgi:hypothetical protein